MDSIFTIQTFETFQFSRQDVNDEDFWGNIEYEGAHVLDYPSQCDFDEEEMLKRKFEVTVDSTLFNDTTPVIFLNRKSESEIKFAEIEKVVHSHLLQTDLHQVNDNTHSEGSRLTPKASDKMKPVNDVENSSNFIEELSISDAYKDRVRFTKDHDRGKYLLYSTTILLPLYISLLIIRAKYFIRNC